MTQNPYERNLMQAFILSLINAVVWFWGLSLSLYLVYQGSYDLTAGSSYGLPYITLAWIVAVGVARLVSRPVCTRLFGYYNKTGFVIAGFLSIPLAVIFAIPLDWITLRSDGANFLNNIFYFASVFGLFPEGLRGSKTYTGLIFIFVFLVGFVGFYFSSRKIKKVLGLIIPLILLGANSSYSYDGLTHEKYLTADAVSLLNAKSEFPYFELTHEVGQIMNGALLEDSPSIMGLYHFYRPTDQRGLFGAWPSAQARLQGDITAGGTNFIEEAINKYTAKNKDGAYQSLGHVLHLAAQDMFSVPHVSDDAHLIVYNQTLNFAPDSYEPWVENHFADIGASAFSKGSVVPVISWPPLALLHVNARATYTAMRIPGTLIKDQANPASGDLRNMFPGPDSTAKCNTLLKNFGRGPVVQTFPRPCV
ncbi:MAG: hypothetical protein M0011_04760 [Elusimicrobia bacterium]|nr:hypothetical protein [Elusimicrobiota bacterium]